jgi:hypothetical protein
MARIAMEISPWPHRHAALGERPLNLQTVNLRHTDVEQDASEFRVSDLLEERLAGTPGFDLIAGRLEHEAHRPADRFLVVDDVD